MMMILLFSTAIVPLISAIDFVCAILIWLDMGNVPAEQIVRTTVFIFIQCTHWCVRETNTFTSVVIVQTTALMFMYTFTSIQGDGIS